MGEDDLPADDAGPAGDASPGGAGAAVDVDVDPVDVDPVDADPAVARFGRFAVRCPDATLCVETAVDLIAAELGARTVALLEVLGPGRVAVVHGRGPTALTPDVWRPDSVEIAPPGLAVPVPVAGAPWGRLIVADGPRRRFTAGEVALVEGVAGILSAALERERVAGARAWVAELGRYALGSPDIELTVQRVVDVAARVLEVPVSAVLRLEPEAGAEVGAEAEPDADPAAATDGAADPGTGAPRRATLMQAWGPIDLDRGERFDLDPDLAAGPPDAPAVLEERGDDVRVPGRACLSVPVRVEGVPWGRLVAADARPRRFTPEEVGTATALADVLAAALERDAVEHRLRHAADDVRRSLLPVTGPVPAPDGLQVVHRAPDDAGWCDVLPLPQGGVALVVGHVPGGDVAAAALAARVRDVTRAFAAEGHAPGVVAARVQHLVAGTAGRPLAWCYAELQPSGPALTWSASGCPGPLVVTPDGVARRLGGTGSVTGSVSGAGGGMGGGAGGGAGEATVLLPPGAAVLLATAEVRAPGAARSVEELAAAAGPGPVIAVRPGPEQGGGSARRVFRPEPESIPAARRFVRDVLAGWQLEAWQQTAALAASELVTNTLLHTASPIDVTVRRTDAGGVWIGVYDDSDRSVRPRPAPPGDDISGRGLVVVSTLADTWGVDPATHGPGKTVWLELAPARGPLRPAPTPLPDDTPETVPAH